MQQKKITVIIIGLFIGMLMVPPALAQQTETTTLEIIGINGGIGGVSVDVKNTGTMPAEGIWVTTSVSGGLFGSVSLTHECTGCSDCGTSLDPGMIKTENTLEVGLLLGIGPIQVTTLAGAENAEEVFMQKTGFIIGPLTIIN